MTTSFKTFNNLHHQEDLFILPNAWDAKSAMLLQEKGFPAVGTSSAAVASGLGYEDGEGMPFDDYLFIIKRIVGSVNIPVTVDMEMGYGKTNEEIVSNISRLIGLGIVGINIEDSGIEKSKRFLKEAKAFVKTIEYIKNYLSENNLHLFVNIRCDTYLLNVSNRQKETINRLKMYETAGANGIFLPCIMAEDDITEAARNTKLPLNVMCMPGLPDFDRLNKLGVKRASMGPFLFNQTYKKAGELMQQILDKKSFSAIV